MSKPGDITRRRYNRSAPLYDIMEGVMEGRRGAKWRRLLWSKAEGTSILEVGVGTGRNFPFYPPDARVTAIDFAEKMLERARRKTAKQGLKVSLEIMDVQYLGFPDDTFDTVLASFVFCSVPDPVLGLTEIKRVCKPRGKILLLEHVLADNRVAAWFMNLLNPIVVRMGGENINRRTVENVARSGLVVEKVTDLAIGIVKLIEARKM